MGNQLSAFLVAANIGVAGDSSGYAVSFLSHVDWKTAALVLVLSGEAYRFYVNTFSFPAKPAEDAIEGDTSPNAHKEIVHLHVFRGSGVTVSSSPFSAKMSMYCRLAGIPHTVSEADMQKGPPKGKVPFLVHNGNVVGDSQLMIRYLENTFDVATMARGVCCTYTSSSSAFIPYADLSPEDQATCEMVRLLCEGQLYWAVVSTRWFGAVGITRSESSWRATVDAYFKTIPSFMRGPIVAMIRKSVFGDAWGTGFSRHSPEDQIYLATRAIKALSVTLGDKSFFLGQHPTEADCIAFGTIQGLCDTSRWPINPLADYVAAECPNLVAYNARVKEDIFGDMCGPASEDVTLPTSKPTPTEPLPFKGTKSKSNSTDPPRSSASTSPKLRSGTKKHG